MSTDSLYDTHLKLTQDDIDFLEKLHKNKSEAIRLLIRKARTSANGNANKARAVLLNITIGFLALGVFYIWALWISWMFLVLAFLIFSFETYDVIHYLYQRHKEHKEIST